MTGQAGLAHEPVGPDTAAAPEASSGPRPVFCVIEHLYRDRAVADDAVAGRFTNAGVRLSLGPQPDWRRDGLGTDEEWRIEWSKFYFGLDLAAAYRATGDPAYLRTWEELVVSWATQVPADADPADVIGRRLQNWVYAWQGFAAPGAGLHRGLSRATTDLLVRSIDEQVRHLRTTLTPERNHRTLELYALLVVALALPALDPTGELCRYAWHQLDDNLRRDVWPDGVHRECSTHYHLIALRSFLGARENARRFGLPVPAGYDDRLRLACRFAMHAHRPDGQLPALSDADSGDHRGLLLLADRLLDDPALRWVATSGTAGAPPPERAVDFPVGGYHVQRSGWGERETAYADERFLILDSGPIGDGGHGHYDMLAIEAYAHGRPLLVDPGRFTYAEIGPPGERNWRHWFKGTAAHSTVTVDGLDQTPYRRGKPRKQTTATARLLDRHRTDGLDLIRAQVTSTQYAAVHTREVLFVADEYWVVVDDLEDEQPHDYVQRMQLDSAAWQRTRVHNRHDDVAVRAPGLALVYPATERPQLQQGWLAPQYGVRRPAPAVTVRRSGAAVARFVTVLYPFPDPEAHRPAPRLRCTAGGRSRAVLVTGVGAGGTQVDHLCWSADPTSMRLGAWQLTARVGWLRTDDGGRRARLLAYDVREHAWCGRDPAPVTSDAGGGWRSFT